MKRRMIIFLLVIFLIPNLTRAEDGPVMEWSQNAWDDVFGQITCRIEQLNEGTDCEPFCDLCIEVHDCTVEPRLIGLSWTDQVEEDIGRSDIITLTTSGVTAFGSGDYLIADPTTYSLDVFLPELPNIQGDQAVELQIGDYKATLRFALTYVPTYNDDRGWECRFLRYDVTPYVVHENPLDSFSHIDVAGFGMALYHEPEPVLSYVMRMDIVACQTAARVTDVSWTEDIFFMNGVTYDPSVIIERLNAGQTVIVNDDLYGGFSYGQDFSPWICLPNDPSITGEQTVTVRIGNSDVTVYLAMEYLGDPAEDLGWNVSCTGYRAA